MLLAKRVLNGSCCIKWLLQSSTPAVWDNLSAESHRQCNPRVQQPRHCNVIDVFYHSTPGLVTTSESQLRLVLLLLYAYWRRPHDRTFIFRFVIATSLIELYVATSLTTSLALSLPDILFVAKSLTTSLLYFLWQHPHNCTLSDTIFITALSLTLSLHPHWHRKHHLNPHDFALNKQHPHPFNLIDIIFFYPHWHCPH